MRYVQLRAFHNVAIHGGFSRAANVLGLSQPAISDQVRNLEEEYDVLLFDRQKKRVDLTPFGEQLLAHTRRLFEIEGQTQEFLAETRALNSGTLKIMADSPHHLLNVLASFRKKYPGIFISVRAGNTDEVIDALQSYKADIGVLGEVPPSKKFNVVQLSSTPIVAFSSVDAPFHVGSNMSLEALAKLPLVMREKGSKTRQILETFARQSKVKLQSAIEAEGREAVREIVAAGSGIGFVSEAEFGHDRRLVKIGIKGLNQHMDEALICLKERQEGKLIRTFMGLASKNLT